MQRLLDEAERYLAGQAFELGSLDRYLYGFTGGRPRRNRWRRMEDIPSMTTESVALSQDLVRRGASFTGPTICYSFMQACGLVNDHLVTCFRYHAGDRESIS